MGLGEKILEHFTNYVKSEKYYVVNDLSDEELLEFRKTSAKAAEEANDIYNLYHDPIR